MDPGELIIRGARQNNLKGIDLRLPHDKVTVITGLSGSGKSSLAFDTIFAEGQWRYIESLSAYARMFLEKVDRPLLDSIENVRPAIAIEQRNPVRTARSTVGTATELHDYLRLLFAKIGRVFCQKCNREARAYSPTTVADELLAAHEGERAQILFPIPLSPGVEGRELATSLLRRGFARLRVMGEIQELGPGLDLNLQGLKEVQVILDRLVLRPEERARLVDSLEGAFHEGKGNVYVEVMGKGLLRFGQELRCYGCGEAFERPQPLLFSFNHPLGACPECRGFGNVLLYDEDLIIPDKSKSLVEGAIEPWNTRTHRWWYRQLERAARRYRINLHKPYADLTDREKKLVFEGADDFEGIDAFFEEHEARRYKLHVRVFLSRYRAPFPCSSCEGRRLRPEALNVKVGEKDIHQVCRMRVEEVAAFFQDLPFSAIEREVARLILRQIHAKLGFLLRMGLGYLTLDRETRTLSGGEAQRINLANQLSSRLTGTLYVLDEPTIGLHPRDTGRLAEIVKDLAGAGNTVVVVEHDRTLMETADYLVELGPRAGEGGGKVVFAGPPAAFLQNRDSLTARYLRGEEVIPLPSRRRPGNGQFLELEGAQENNLKGINVKIPLHTFTCITGVSGSGKSTLVHDTLYKALARAFKVEFSRVGQHQGLYGVQHLRGVRLIDQEPVGRTPRSNPITY
ncbi:MAG: excinuclease ABC subunit UvrA, partial [candidate division NC10 bacterium]|nr:excinuclease ABC subunit UvrA [candidate division NC10 bacterium]